MTRWRVQIAPMEKSILPTNTIEISDYPKEFVTFRERCTPDRKNDFLDFTLDPWALFSKKHVRVTDEQEIHNIAYQN